jgi:predicted Zn-dependent protease
VEAETILADIEASLREERVKNYEIYMQVPIVTQLFLRCGEVELLNVAKHFGYGIRILERGFGTASSNQTRRSHILECIKTAKFIAKHSKPEKFSFPDQKGTAQVDIVDKKVKNDPENAVKEFAEKIINAADTEKVELPFAKVKAFNIRTLITNSEGLHREKEETLLFTEVSFKTSALDKLSEYWTTAYGRRPFDISDETLERWARLSKENLKAKTPKTEKLEVIFPPHVVCDLIVPVVGAHSTGRALKLGISKFAKDELVADESFTVLDDGLYPYGLQSSPFDDEGNPQGRVPLIEKGVFKNYLFDQYYGLQFGEKSTGNGIRQTMVHFIIDEKFKLTPSNQTSNLRIMTGSKSYEELISEVEKGLLVYNLSWLYPDSATGAFGSEIRNAALIEKGEITTPIKGGLISGNVFTLIKNITGISNQAKIVSGQTAFCCVSPYMRFKDVQVAGD